ncbi:MAG: carbon starvation protein A [Phycisphaerae bacterium]|nr:carbon starvation protein A [Phycisphaerae bacterium]
MSLLTNALGITLLCMGILYLGYKVYGGFLAKRVLGFDDAKETPAHRLRDGIDFVPTHPAILFGHHFASIAGLGPIAGPAIAVYWGWVPALLWVMVGCILIGGVHDLVTLFASLRHDGRTIGDLTYDIINGRARALFLIVIFFLLALAMGTFALLMSQLFTDLSPQAVVPTFALIAIAMIFGVCVYRFGWRLGPATLVGVGLMFIATFLGLEVPVPLYKAFVASSQVKQVIATTDDPDLPQVHGIRATRADKTLQYFESRVAERPEYEALAADVRKARQHALDSWTYILLIYAFLASILPVWLLLQPRDYINSYQLYFGLAVLLLGLLVWRPEIVGPAFGVERSADAAVSDPAPGPLPFLFITIACGAVSGFHNLVSSGTTARQIRRETDSHVIGYGAMLTEGLLAVMVIMVCVAGLSSEEFHHQYGTWRGLDGRALGSFLTAASHVIAKPFLVFFSESRHAAVEAFSYNFIAVVVVSFAMTTLDTGTRLLRFNVEAISKLVRVPALGNRYLSSFIAVLAIGYFALMKIGGKPAGLTLWQLFGTSNQLLAVLGLLVAAVYLHQLRRPIVWLVVPMIFMLITVIWAMLLKLGEFYSGWQASRDAGNASLMALGAALVLLAGWMVVEATLVFFRGRKTEQH